MLIGPRQVAKRPTLRSKSAQQRWWKQAARPVAVRSQAAPTVPATKAVGFTATEIRLTGRARIPGLSSHAPARAPMLKPAPITSDEPRVATPRTNRIPKVWQGLEVWVEVWGQSAFSR